MARRPRPKTPADGAIDLNKFIPVLLQQVASRLTTSGSAQYRRGFGIGIMEFRVMVMLESEPGCSGARIAEVAALDKAAISRTVNSLVRRGLASVTSGRGKAHVISLTPEGSALYARARHLALERERRLLQQLSPEEAQTLRRLLQELLAGMPEVEKISPEPDAASATRTLGPQA